MTIRSRARLIEALESINIPAMVFNTTIEERRIVDNARDESVYALHCKPIPKIRAAGIVEDAIPRVTSPHIRELFEQALVYLKVT